MSEKKAYTPDFEAEPPKAERKGGQRRGLPEYEATIDVFFDSGMDYAKVQIPAGKKLSNVQIGLRSAIQRKGKANDIKPIKRKKELYLITKAYSDKRRWVWKTERKKKK